MTKRRFGKDGESLDKSWNWIRQRFRERPLSFSLVAVGLLFLLMIVGNTVRLGDTGFEPKTLWDWMDLLLVPFVLAIGGWWLNKTQKDSEREQAEKNREEDRKRAEQQVELERELAEKHRLEERQIARERREQETLEAYFDRMTELLLKHNLHRNNQEGDETEAQSIARARTLAVLRNLGPERKGNVIQFLYEAHLIGDKENATSTIDLHGVDLRNADLIWANLTSANLVGVNLIGANLTWAYLMGAGLRGAKLMRANLKSADLIGADLRGANLRRANLIGANLGGANLTGADLIGANLTGVDLIRADLRRARLIGTKLIGANLTGTDLSEADLRGADLRGAILVEVNLRRAKRNHYTIWPDGFDPVAAGAILVSDDGNAIEEPNEDLEEECIID